MPSDQPKLSKWESIKKVFNYRQIIIFILGFSSGYPLVLTGSTFKLWLAQDKIDIKTIGALSAVGIAYSLKFLWAPFLDRYFLSFFGRRKTWIVVSQILLAAGLYGMSQLNPTEHLATLAGWAVFVALMSATQDIAIDAYRREFLPIEAMGLGASMSTYGYRVAMWFTSGFLVALVVDTTPATSAAIESIQITWNEFYMISAGIMGVLAALSIFIPEPKVESIPRTLKDAVIQPFIEFFTREGSLMILLFIITFKLGDQISASLLSPFYKEMGYINLEIGLITKTYGMFSSFAGLFVGAMALIRFSVRSCLWVFGILQALSTAAFALITFTGPMIWSLSVVVIFEDFASGMGTAAFATYIASMTNTKYTATQFALLTSVATVGRTFLSVYSGYMKEALGWAGFFYACALLAIPGLMLLAWLNRRQPARV